MIRTGAEWLALWALPHGGALTDQRNGRISWLAMAGKSKEWVNKGGYVLTSGSLFALRPAMKELTEFWADVVEIERKAKANK